MLVCRVLMRELSRHLGAAQAPQGSAVYADSGSKISSTVAAVGSSAVACDYCLFQGPGATTFTNLTSAGSRALSPGSAPSPSGSTGGSSISGGAIAGIIIGALAGVALLALLAWLLLRRRKRAAKDVEMAKAEPVKPQVTSAKNRTAPGAPLVPDCLTLHACRPLLVLNAGHVQQRHDMQLHVANVASPCALSTTLRFTAGRPACPIRRKALQHNLRSWFHA